MNIAPSNIYTQVLDTVLVSTSGSKESRSILVSDLMTEAELKVILNGCKTYSKFRRAFCKVSKNRAIARLNSTKLEVLDSWLLDDLETLYTNHKLHMENLL